MRERRNQAARAYRAWIAAKRELASRMHPEDFNAFVRPIYLLMVLSEHYMLLSMPPNKRLVERARNFQSNIAAAIARHGYSFAGFARYPVEYEDFAAIPEEFLTPILRGRRRAAEQRRAAEDARDRMVAA